MWLLLLACAGQEEAAEPVERVQPWAEGRTLRDAEGRELRLHGMNARVNGLFDVTFEDGRTALETIPTFGEADCAFLADDLGMNLLRLPLNWSGMEPEDGVWNEAYFSAAETVVDACWAHGVYTMLDIHQDAYSKEIGEDGAPLWAIVPAPEELLEGPLEDLAERRTSMPVLLAFRSLYAGDAGLHEAYGEMAGELAARFADHPGVAGLELHNEPVPLGDLDALDAFHAAVAGAVRDRAPDMLLLFEPDSLRNLTDSAEVSTPFPYDNAVYAPHVYTDVFEDGWASQDEAAVAASVAAADAEARAHGTALFVGEFGHDPSTEQGLRYIEVALDAFDTNGASWAFWLYEEWSQGRWGLYEGDAEARGALREPIADLLARPFPAAIDGIVEGAAWDGATLAVTIAEAGPGEHLIATPGRTWPDTVEVTCDDAPADATREGGRIRVRCSGSRLIITGD